jgi:hypothetical protein
MTRRIPRSQRPELRPSRHVTGSYSGSRRCWLWLASRSTLRRAPASVHYVGDSAASLASADKQLFSLHGSFGARDGWSCDGLKRGGEGRGGSRSTIHPM